MTVGLPLYQRCAALLGTESAATRELRTGLDHLGIGYHRYGLSDKREAYRAASGSEFPRAPVHGCLWSGRLAAGTF